jgi:hypothetical protein
MTIRRVICAAAAAGALVLLGAGPAAATTTERFDDTDSFDIDACEGVVVHDEVTARGTDRLRPSAEPGGPSLLTETYRVHEILTANGHTLTIDRRGVYKEVSARHVRGTTWEITRKETGQPFVVRDESGAAIYHDRGVLVSTIWVDTKGDDDRENDEFVEGGNGVLRDKGDHAGFSADFCVDIAPLFLD